MTTTAVETGATPAQAAPGATPAALATLPTNLVQGAGAPAAPSPTAPATGTQTTTAAPAAETAPNGQPPKASDPAQLLADLAGERDKRQAAQAAQTAADAKLAAVLAALGIGGADAAQQTPEQIATAAQASEKAARLELAAYRGAPANVNVAALLDSRAFSDALGKLDPANGPAITAAIVDYVKDKPQFLTGRPGAGTSDAAAGVTPGTGAATMDDLIRGRH